MFGDFEGMARLNTERQERLEPTRMQRAIDELSALGYSISNDDKKISFMFKGNAVFFYPYSGWATGKNIQDGRGLQNLINQIK